jgi:4-hydroxy-tetrahydrodipicolinate synthase
MMKNSIFKGTGTAHVTPFKKDLSIDFAAFHKLLDFQLESGVESLIICGSTGEGATLSDLEKIELIELAVKKVNGKIPIIAGTGSNNTAASIKLSNQALKVGADAVLLVAPYYNKPTQEGLYRHYMEINDKVELPQILYNVPGRSGINILPDTQLRLAKDGAKIYATKEASGDMDQILRLVNEAPEGFDVYSGDDSLAVPLCLMGADGVISVISNYAPRIFSDAVRAAMKGELDAAKKLHFRLRQLMGLNFVESNPIPVKAILAIMGLVEENYRLPLTSITPENRKKLEAALSAASIM